MCDSLKQDTYIRKCVSACIVIICNVILSYVCLSKPLLILRTTSFLKAFCFAALEVGVLCKRLCVCAPNQRSLLPLRLPITLTERVWADQQHKESSMAGLIEFEFKYIIYIYEFICLVHTQELPPAHECFCIVLYYLQVNASNIRRLLLPHGFRR